jgi:hypothetical protein
MPVARLTALPFISEFFSNHPAMNAPLLAVRPKSIRLKSAAVAALLFSLTACQQQTPPAPPQTAPPVQNFSCDFESSNQLPSGWITEGDVAIDEKEAFKGSHSLVLSRTEPDADKPCSVVTSPFKTQPGLWNVGGEIKPDLYSPDSSFDCVVTLECLDASGKVANSIIVSDVFGQNGWNAFGGQYEIPKGTDSSRFRIQLNKTYGKLWIDDLSATYLGEAPHKFVDRLVLSTVALGNLLYPTDSRVVNLSVLAPEELPAESQVVNFTVCDYWGAEQMAPAKVTLTEGAKQGDNFSYTGSIDLASVPLEQGKYYEMIGEIPLPDKPYRNHSGIAILPEAVTNSYPPEQTPFTGRNWDGRIPTGFDLSHRMGIRIMNVWSGWDAKPPYTPHAPAIDKIEQYKMGVIFGTPDGAIEHQSDNWKDYDDAAERGGIKALLDTFGKNIHPIYIDLGNEPPDRPDFIADDVKAYKAVYEAAKQWNPNVTVIGTSIGPTEDFFKGGFGKYCDVYDFHCYEAPKSIAMTIKKYQEMFKKYGNPKPIWSTEIGLNSEGVSRHTVSIDMMKKFAIFFASGGDKISWFDLFYPDMDAKNYGSNGESFDVFDSRYEKYNPKITAITDYDLINTISIKKFVEQKQYGDIASFLMRDKDKHNLQIVWKEGGRKDVFMPLPGAHTVEVVKLDGTHRKLDADGKGVTLTIGEEPMLLLYDGAVPLANSLGDPAATVAFVPTGVVRGGSVDVVVNLKDASAENLNLVTPPFWTVQKNAGQGAVTFTATAPAASGVREAEMTVTIGNGKTTSGELYLRLPVTAQVSSELAPVPPANGQAPAVKLTLKNNGTQKQDVNWAVTLTGQITLEKGSYEKHVPTQAHFTTDSKGQASLEPGASQDVVLPIADTDPLTVYQVRSVVTDSSGAAAIRDRNVAGFVAVPKTTGPISLDGTLDEADWKNAPVEKIDEERQYTSYEPATLKWKGPADLSGTIRYLWDDKYLYVGVEVTDDIEGGKKDDNMLWAQDGLQFLVDPCRGLDENVGKYDYSIADGKNGLRAWCDLTADPGAPNGVASDIKVSAKRKGDGTGAITYEIAFPWSRLAPFKPGTGADLGLTMILNEDDGQGRKSYMGWFGNASSKQVDAVGDLILQP